MIGASTATIVFDQAALDELLRSPSGPVGKELARIGARVEGRAKQLLSGELVGVVSGRLRSSTSWRLIQQGDRLGVSIISGVGYSIHVHEGTRHLEGRPFLKIAARDVLGASFI